MHVKFCTSKEAKQAVDACLAVGHTLGESDDLIRRRIADAVAEYFGTDDDNEIIVEFTPLVSVAFHQSCLYVVDNYDIVLDWDD